MERGAQPGPHPPNERGLSHQRRKPGGDTRRESDPIGVTRSWQAEDGAC